MKITFLGGVGTVTGSKYLVETASKKILIDCGLFQGLKHLRKLNRQSLPVDATSIDLVLLTHGHLDHVGYLPLLYRHGYSGQVWGTPPSLEVASIVLRDSAKIQEEDAERANKYKYSRHAVADPLFTLEEVERVIPFFDVKLLEKWYLIDDNIECRFKYNGHILGATFIELKIEGKMFVFSGDIGRNEDPLMFPPEKPVDADVLILESTYGNRIHPANPERALVKAINEAYRRNGTIIIPGFAVERMQMLLFLIWQARKSALIPFLPVYMDSPMGKAVLDLFGQYSVWHKLPSDDYREMCRELKKIETQHEGLPVLHDKKAKIILAGSGMATGGRVLKYFEQYLGDPDASVLLVGYQAEGTRGRQLLEGADEIKFYGKFHKVKANVINVKGLSAHADQAGILDWLSALKTKPSEVFITHGEPKAADALRVKLQDELQITAEIPELFESVVIDLNKLSEGTQYFSATG